MLVEIFSYLSQKDRLNVALVSKYWFDAARSHRFDLPIRKFKISSSKTRHQQHIQHFLDIFKENSMSLPVKCIQIELEENGNDTVGDLTMDEKIKLGHLFDIIKQYHHVKVEVDVSYWWRVSFFESVIKFIPKMVKKVYWSCVWSCDGENLEQDWLNICDAVSKKKEFEVIIRVRESDVDFQDLLSPSFINEVLPFLSKAPPKNIIIKEAILSMDINSSQHKILFEMLSNVTTLYCIAETQEHFNLINTFMGQNATLNKLCILFSNGFWTPKPVLTQNFMELLPNANKLQVSDVIRGFLKFLFVIFYFWRLQDLELKIEEKKNRLSLTQTVLNFPQLKKFAAELINDFYDCETLEKIIKSFPSLEEIELRFHGDEIDEISDEDIFDIVQNICEYCRSLKKLTIIAVRGSKLYTDADDILWLLSSSNLQYQLEILKTDLLCSDLIIFETLHLSDLTELRIYFDRVSSLIV